MVCDNLLAIFFGFAYFKKHVYKNQSLIEKLCLQYFSVYITSSDYLGLRHTVANQVRGRRPNSLYF